MAAARPASRLEAAERLAALAARQYGLVTRRQARGLGLSEAAISRLLAGGTWQRRSRGLLALAAAPVSWRQALMAACLLSRDGTVVSHRAAGALWNLDGCPPGIVEISTRRRSHALAHSVISHRLGDLIPADRAEIEGLPVTSMARTLVDLAAVVEEEALEIALDSALRYRRTSVARLRWHLSRVAHAGRKGTGVLMRMLNERSRHPGRSESALETRVLRGLRRARLPLPIRQFRAFDEAGFVGRVDLAWPGVMLAVECDSYRFHSSAHAWRRDRKRDNRLTAAGWTVLRPTSQDADDPSELVEAIRKSISSPLC